MRPPGGFIIIIFTKRYHNHINKNIAQELVIREASVNNTVELFKGGATIPFIARYRKEKTNGLDEIQIKNIKERFDYYTELEKRKVTILETIKEMFIVHEIGSSVRLLATPFLHEAQKAVKILNEEFPDEYYTFTTCTGELKRL